MKYISDKEYEHCIPHCRRKRLEKGEEEIRKEKLASELSV
jgi:hypothetical protein